MFGQSALSCHQPECKLRQCFSIHGSSWLEDQSVSSPSPSPLLPVRLPGAGASYPAAPPLPSPAPHPSLPSHPHAHTLKCTVCKSAPRGAAHLFSESPALPHPTPTKPKQLKPTQCVNTHEKMKDKYEQVANKNTRAQISFPKNVSFIKRSPCPVFHRY